MDTQLESSIRNKIGFTEDDLNANRDGKLSDAQRDKLKAKLQGVWVLAVLGLVAVIGVLVKTVFDNQFQRTEKLAIVTLVCLVLAVGFLYIWLKWSQYTSDLDRSIAFAAEGRMQLVTYHNRGNNSYRVRVNHEGFVLDRRLFDLLTEVSKEYEFCAVYYTPQSHVLLSFEVIDRN